MTPVGKLTTLCPSDIDDSHSDEQTSENESFANLLYCIISFFNSTATRELNLARPSCQSVLKDSYTFSGRNHVTSNSGSRLISAEFSSKFESFNFSTFFGKAIFFFTGWCFYSASCVYVWGIFLSQRTLISISLFGTFYRSDQVFFLWYCVNLNLVFLFPNPKLLQDWWYSARIKRRNYERIFCFFCSVTYPSVSSLIHPFSSAPPRLGRGGRRLSRVIQTSFSPPMLSRCSKTSCDM